MLNVISKRTEPSSRDAMMDGSHKKGSVKLYAIDSQKRLKISQVETPQSNDPLNHFSGLIKSNHADLRDTTTCNMGWGHHK